MAKKYNIFYYKFFFFRIKNSYKIHKNDMTILSKIFIFNQLL